MQVIFCNQITLTLAFEKDDTLKVPSFNAKTKINCHIRENNEYSRKLDASKVSNFSDILKISSCQHGEDVWNSLARGTAVLQEPRQAEQYMFSYGRMHHAKMTQACEVLADRLIKEVKSMKKHTFHIIDWGCGQGLASMVFFDNFSELIKDKKLNLTFVELSVLTLERAVINVKKYTDRFDGGVTAVLTNKDVNQVENMNHLSDDSIKIHLFSNFLDVNDVKLERLARMIQRDSKGLNFFICVSPLKEERLSAFMNYFSCINHSFELISERSIPILNTSTWGTKIWNRIEKIFVVKL
jgi:hypothetical protein